MDSNDDQLWASEQLARADDAKSKMQTASVRRTQIYLAVWAVSATALVLAIGLLDTVWLLASMAAWAVVVVVGGLWSRRWGTVGLGSAAQIRRGTIGWAVVYAIVIACGAGGKIENLWFWIVGAAATAVPLLMAARQCARCADTQASGETGATA